MTIFVLIRRIKSIVTRSIALAVSVCLIDSSIHTAEAARALSPTAASWYDGFVPPGRMGYISDVYRFSPTAPTVVLVQDLHAHYGAQKNIAGILDHLAPRRDAPPPFVLAVEGASGPVDSSVMALFPDKKIKQAALDYLMREGMVTGMEYFTAMRGWPRLLQGVEDDRYYTLNRDLFWHTSRDRERFVGTLKALQRQIKPLKARIFSKNLRRFERKCEDFRQGKLLLADYVSLLSREAAPLGIRLNSPKPRSQDARFWENLETVGYVIKDSKAKTHHEKSLLALERDLNLLIKVANLQATETDVRSFGPRFNQFVALAEDLLKVKPSALIPPAALRPLMSSVIDYYALVMMRNKPMIDNTLALVNGGAGTDRRVAVLVAGGFHTAPLTQILKSKQANYVVITPMVETFTPDDEALYLKRLKGELPTISEILTASRKQTIASAAGIPWWPQRSADGLAVGFKTRTVVLVGAALFAAYAYAHGFPADLAHLQHHFAGTFQAWPPISDIVRGIQDGLAEPAAAAGAGTSLASFLLAFKGDAPTIPETEIQNGEQWFDLSQLAGFIDSLILTQDARDRPNYRKDWMASPDTLESALVSARGRYRPAELGFHAKRQASASEQALVELTSNGMDAVDAWISRFGLGFYQSLGELEMPGDRVYFAGQTAEGERLGLVFRLSDDGRLQTRVMTADELHLLLQGRPELTRVRVQKALTAEDQSRYRAYLRDRLRGSRRMAVRLNGRLVNPLDSYWAVGEKGPLRYQHPDEITIEMDADGYTVSNPGRIAAEMLFEKLIIPRQGRETGAERAQKENENSPAVGMLVAKGPAQAECQVTIQVAGMGLSHVALRGFHLPPEINLQFPPQATFNTARDEIVLDDIFIQAMTDIIRRLARHDDLEQFVLATNALMAYWAHTSPRSKRDQTIADRLQDTMKTFLQGMIQEKLAAIPPDQLEMLPSRPEFGQLAQSNASARRIFIHPDFFEFDGRPIAGLVPVEGFRSRNGMQLWRATFQEGTAHPPIVRQGQLIILDDAVYQWAKDDAWKRLLINWWLTMQVGYGEPLDELGWWYGAEDTEAPKNTVPAAGDGSPLPRKPLVDSHMSQRLAGFHHLSDRIPARAGTRSWHLWQSWLWTQALRPENDGPDGAAQAAGKMKQWHDWALRLWPERADEVAEWAMTLPLSLEDPNIVHPWGRPGDTRKLQSVQESIRNLQVWTLPDGRLAIAARGPGGMDTDYLYLETQANSGYFRPARLNIFGAAFLIPFGRWRDSLTLDPDGCLVVQSDDNSFVLMKEDRPGSGIFIKLPNTLPFEHRDEVTVLPDGRIQFTATLGNDPRHVYRQEKPGPGEHASRLAAARQNPQSHDASLEDGRVILIPAQGSKETVRIEIHAGGELFTDLPLTEEARILLDKKSVEYLATALPSGRLAILIGNNSQFDEWGSPPGGNAHKAPRSRGVEFRNTGVGSVLLVEVRHAGRSEMRPLQVDDGNGVRTPIELGGNTGAMATHADLREAHDGRLILFARIDGPLKRVYVETSPHSGTLRAAFSPDISPLDDGDLPFDVLSDGRVVMRGEGSEFVVQSELGGNRVIPLARGDAFFAVDGGYVLLDLQGRAQIVNWKRVDTPPAFDEAQVHRMIRYIAAHRSALERPGREELLQRLMRNVAKGGPDILDRLELAPFLTLTSLRALHPQTVAVLRDLQNGRSFSEQERLLQFVEGAAYWTAGKPELLRRFVERWVDLVLADEEKAGEFLAMLQREHFWSLREAYMGDPVVGAAHWQGFLDYVTNPLGSAFPTGRPDYEPDVFGPHRSPMSSLGGPTALGRLLGFLRKHQSDIAEAHAQANAGDASRPLRLETIRRLFARLGAKVDPRSQTQAVRRTIRAQADGYAVWIRELFQNARDELRRYGRIGEPIRISGWFEGSSRVVRVSDPIGMSLEKILSVYLQVDKSDKKGGNFTGKLGQGKYSVWLDADRVRIHTGEGRGLSYTLELQVTARDKQGRPLDIEVLRCEEFEDDFQGTVIEHIVDYPAGERSRYVQAALFHHAVMTFIGDVSPAEGPVLFQNARIRENVTVLSQVEDPALQGAFSVGWTEGQTRVTADGLLVHSLTEEDWQGVHEVVRRPMETRGQVLFRWPSGTPLTEPRTQAALREMDPARWQRLRLTAIFLAAVEAIQQHGLWLLDMPEDVLTMSRSIPWEIQRHAKAIAAGRWADVDWSPYMQDGNKALWLIMALPGRAGGQSLLDIHDEIQTLIQSNDVEGIARLKQRLPGLRARIDHATQRVQTQQDDQRRRMTTPQGIAEEAELSRKTLGQARLRRMQRLFTSMMRALGQPTMTSRLSSTQSAEAFVRSDNFFVIHFSKIWAEASEKVLRSLKRSTVLSETVGRSVLAVATTLDHEYGHTQELAASGGSSHLTHSRDGVLEKSFPQRMRQGIERLIEARWDVRAATGANRAGRKALKSIVVTALMISPLIEWFSGKSEPTQQVAGVADPLTIMVMAGAFALAVTLNALLRWHNQNADRELQDALFHQLSTTTGSAQAPAMTTAEILAPSAPLVTLLDRLQLRDTDPIHHTLGIERAGLFHVLAAA